HRATSGWSTRPRGRQATRSGPGRGEPHPQNADVPTAAGRTYPGGGRPPAGPGVGPVTVFRLRNTAHPRSAHRHAPASRPGHVRVRVGECPDARLLVGDLCVFSARDEAVEKVGVQDEDLETFLPPRGHVLDVPVHVPAQFLAWSE